MVLWDGGEKEDNNNQERGLHLVWPAGFIVSSRSPPLLNVPLTQVISLSLMSFLILIDAITDSQFDFRLRQLDNAT